MKRTVLLFCCLLATIQMLAQAPMTNTAFNDGEKVSYLLKFSLGPINMTVGTAEWSIGSTTYKGTKGHKISLRTTTNKRADKYFILRDTMTTYVTDQLVPMLFDKKGRESKRYKVDRVEYSYSGGKCHVSNYHRLDSREPTTSKYSSTACAYDMVSMMVRARSMDATGWKVGHKIKFVMADGKRCATQSIVYRGKKEVKLDNGEKFSTLVFSFLELEDGKESEIVRFYVTDDANHLPVRLDMNLTFGKACAYMTGYSGLRNKITSKK